MKLSVAIIAQNHKVIIVFTAKSRVRPMMDIQVEIAPTHDTPFMCSFQSRPTPPPPFRCFQILIVGQGAQES